MAFASCTYVFEFWNRAQPRATAAGCAARLMPHSVLGYDTNPKRRTNARRPTFEADLSASRDCCLPAQTRSIQGTQQSVVYQQLHEAWLTSKQIADGRHSRQANSGSTDARTRTTCC